MPAEPPEQAIHREDGAVDLPAQTATRPAETGQWDPRDLTSERDVELDTVTVDQQVRIRRIAIELVKGSKLKAGTSS
jgi:hypothetical protein